MVPPNPPPPIDCLYVKICHGLIQTFAKICLILTKKLQWMDKIAIVSTIV